MSQSAELLPHDEGMAVLRARFGELVTLWDNRQKPRTATVLKTAVIDDDKITVFASNDILQTEILNSKIEIESDMVRMFNFRLPLEVGLREEFQIERPITLKQRVEHLAAKNPEVTKLTEVLDLTI